MVTLGWPESRANESSVEGGSLYNLPLQWKDQAGKQGVKLSDWVGRPLVLTLAYTQCRRVCPSTTYKRLRMIQKEFKRQGVQPEYVVVTLDPESDTPEVLQSFKKRFNGADDHWHFLTGEKEAVKKLAESVDYRFWELDTHVIHDFKIWLLDTKGSVRRVMDLQNLDIPQFVAGLDPKK
jgi:protein SCO1/2